MFVRWSIGNYRKDRMRELVGGTIDICRHSIVICVITRSMFVCFVLLGKVVTIVNKSKLKVKSQMCYKKCRY